MRLRTTLACAALLTAVAVGPVTAQEPMVPQPMPDPAKPPATRQIQGFNIVLVLGETQPSGGTGPTDDLAGGAKNALNDIREFLPYKHYRVLDSQWTSCCGGLSAKLSGRLRGVVGMPGRSNAVNLVHRPYGFNLTVNNSSAGLAVRFGLSLDEGEGRPSPIEAGRDLALERADLQAEFATLSLQLREAQRRVEIGQESELAVRQLHDKHASVQRRLEALGADAQRATPFGGRPIIDSSFSMDPGETVVVGTSRLGGDKALIALVTAVRRTGSK